MPKKEISNELEEYFHRIEDGFAESISKLGDEIDDLKADIVDLKDNLQKVVNTLYAFKEAVDKEAP